MARDGRTEGDGQAKKNVGLRSEEQYRGLITAPKSEERAVGKHLSKKMT